MEPKLLDCMNRLIARGHADLATVLAGAGSAPGKSVGLFAPIPARIAKGFPPRNAIDTSVPHITILYVGDVPLKRQKEFVAAVQPYVKRHREMPIEMTGVGYFPPSDHSEGKRVAYMEVSSPRLIDLHHGVKRALKRRGFDVKSNFSKYVPHATLDYIDPDTEWSGEPVLARWMQHHAEVWGFGPPVRCNFMRGLRRKQRLALLNDVG